MLDLGVGPPIFQLGSDSLPQKRTLETWEGHLGFDRRVYAEVHESVLGLAPADRASYRL